MNEGIVARGELAEILEQRMRVAGSHDLYQIIDDIGQPLGQLGPGDILEEAFQERVGGRQALQRFLPAERLEIVIVKARGEHAVGDRLGIDVRKLTRRQIGQKVLLEALVLAAKAGIEIGIIGQGNADLVFNDRGLCRHELCQLRGRADADRLLFCEEFKLALEISERVWIRLEPHEEVGNRNEVDRFLVANEFEIDAVGIDQVGIGRFVALALLD